MKKILLLTIVLCLISRTFASYKEVPSLEAIAAKKVDIESEGFKQLSKNVQDHVLQQKGTLQQTMDFINANPDIASKELFFTIPDRFFQAFLNKAITINDFLRLVKSLSTVNNKKVVNAFANKIIKNLDKDRVILVSFGERAEAECIGLINQKEDHLPVDYIYILKGKFLREPFFLKRLSIVIDIDYLIGLFIMRKLEELLIDALEEKYGHDYKRYRRTLAKFAKYTVAKSEYMISKKLMAELDPLMKQLNNFAATHTEKFSDLEKYIKKFVQIFNNIRNGKYRQVTIEPYVFDKINGDYEGEWKT